MQNLELIGKRVDNMGYVGTIRYVGPLRHTVTNKKIKVDDKWLGIEWDIAERGNHGGKVGGYEYFKLKYNQKGGSLIKEEKVSLGVDAIEGYVNKYFKPKDAQEILKNKDNIVDCLMEYGHQQEQKHIVENLSEYDDMALIKTSKSYKRIEFMGFEKIWSIITNVKKMRDLSLSGFAVSSMGVKGSFGTLFTNLKSLSLENNLLYSWDEVKRVAYECPRLESLWLNGNRLKFREQLNNAKKAYKKRFYSKIEGGLLAEDPELNDIEFKNLVMLACSDMFLCFKDVSKVAKLFPNIDQIVLSNNNCNDFENFTVTDEEWPNLEKMDLSGNSINTCDGFKHLSEIRLTMLNLTSNGLKRFNAGQYLQDLTHLNISQNSIKSERIFKDLSEFPNLISLRIGNNPIVTSNDKTHIRFFFIASILNLKQFNGTAVDRDLRRDAEIYYFSQTFKNFFIHSKTNEFNYDYNAYLEWACKLYPHIEYYLKKYGNPYPIEERYLEERPELIQAREEANKRTGVIIDFFKVIGFNETYVVERTFPLEFDVRQIRKFCKTKMNLKKQPFSLTLHEKDKEAELNDDFALIKDIVKGKVARIKVQISTPYG